MDFLSRINAVLHGKPPDRVPFAPYDNLVPRGAFERELRNRGMGLCVRVSTVWSEMPHVTTERYAEGESVVTVYHTPAGDVSTRTRGHAGRISDGLSVETEGMIKTERMFKAGTLAVMDAIEEAGTYPTGGR